MYGQPQKKGWHETLVRPHVVHQAAILNDLVVFSIRPCRHESAEQAASLLEHCFRLACAAGAAFEPKIDR